MKGIIGYYSGYGYKVCIIDNGQIEDEIYYAGNNKLSSATSDNVPISSVQCLSLEKLKEYCLNTSKEIAEEKHLPHIGIELLDI